MFRNQLLALCALLTLVTACSKKDKGHDETTTVTSEAKAIQEYLSVTTGLTIFAASFKEVSIAAADVSGGVTVFAPDNSAITNYDPNARVEAIGLTADEVKDHIVKGIIKKSDLTNGKKFTALSGKELLIVVDGDNIYINGVLIADVNEDVSKQVVYKIANVLCKKPGAAEISVYDGTQWSTTDTQGKLAGDADVTLYYTRTDYLNNNKVAATGKTNAGGKITFSGLNPGIYYLVVKKGDKYNYFEPDTYNGKPVSLKPVGIFQNANQINSLTALPNSAPGDFMYQDSNGDGKIDANDKVYYPFEVIVTSNKTVQVTSFIGYKLNHLGAAFTSKADAQAFLDNLYISIGNWHQLQTVIDGVLSDDADCSFSSTFCPLDNFSITPANTFTSSLWTVGYGFVGSLNRLITNLPALNLPSADANAIIAQAKGLRAFIFYELATYYGALPLQTNMIDDNKLSRSTLADTYQFIKNDLNAAITVLPARQTGADHRRMSADACRLLLARIAMAQGDFGTAKQLTNSLIQSAAYSLVSTGDIFVNDANAEIIWNIGASIQSAYATFFSDGTGKTFCPAARYAEVLLINSEARVALGELDATYINQLLGRRSQPTVTFTTNDQARDVVRLTWKTELHHEGQRFAKVVKWGTAMEAVGSKGYKNYNSLMPIPQTLLVNNPNITQNPGY
jgi:starch-binding outer membrane protein, SusD/RagB family